MLFSSNIFIFIFLPMVIFIYYIILKRSRKYQNIFLCIASLFFYAWGEPRFVLIMILSIFVNWEFGLLIDEHRQSKYIKLLLAADIAFNIVIIFIFKYLMFTVENINLMFSTEIKMNDIALPIGISFFTFQAISYVVDVYRKKGEAQRNLLNVGLYISFFPQLIAGPIVRYETVAYQITYRKESFDDFSYGVVRFITGLGKKVIIANNMAVVADKAFELIQIHEGGQGLTMGMAWIGAIAYTLQIFFDFSGYSDMAIGLGKMFGFHFMENFNYPYVSKSATEFWRRWHISLSTWFRDYVYIPLGGSRVKKSRHVLNLLIVWLCTGIWHGANWTFIIWGLMYFVLQLFEKTTGLDRDSEHRTVNILKHIYIMFFVVLGWVVFRADDLNMAWEYMKYMFGFNGINGGNSIGLFYLREYGIFFALGIIFSLPIAPKVSDKIMRKNNIIISVIYAFMMLGVFLISISYIVKGSYNPFIYFNF